jgi:hypothetical protein
MQINTFHYAVRQCECARNLNHAKNDISRIERKKIVNTWGAGRETVTSFQFLSSLFYFIFITTRLGVGYCYNQLSQLPFKTTLTLGCWAANQILLDRVRHMLRVETP